MPLIKSPVYVNDLYIIRQTKYLSYHKMLIKVNHLFIVVMDDYIANL